MLRSTVRNSVIFALAYAEAASAGGATQAKARVEKLPRGFGPRRSSNDVRAWVDRPHSADQLGIARARRNASSIVETMTLDRSIP